MTQPEPRYEYRLFGADLRVLAERLRSLGSYRNRRESTEIYLVGGSETHNCKIRGGRLEIKERLAVERGLERWRPRLKAAFPLRGGLLEDELYPALALNGRRALREHYDSHALLEELKAAGSGIHIVRILKRRTAYNLGGCQAEYVKLLTGRSGLESVAVESADPGRVLAALETLGLDATNNTSYPRAVAQLDRHRG